MAGKWSELSLLEVYDVSSGLSKGAEYFGQGYPFLSFKDVFRNTFLPNQLEQLVLSEDKERNTCSVKKGDVFITRTSETMHELGMSSVALKDYPEATFNGFTKRLRPKSGTEKILHPEYVGYYLRSPLFRQKMLAFSTMSTRASLNNEMIGRLTITYPELAVQKRVSGVLKCLDEKIELNCQTNQTLEQMAQVLFKSWFVDFDPVIDNALAAGNEIPEALKHKAEQRAIYKVKAQQLQASPETKSKPLPDDIRALFPSEFEQTDEPNIGIAGWIPKGWRVSSTDAELGIKGGSTPSTKNPDFWDGGDIHWTSPKDLSGNNSKILLDTSRKITEAGLAKITSGLLPVDTVLMSSRAPVGYLALAKVPLAINQGYIALQCGKNLTPEYTMQFLDSIMDEIKGISGGTTFAEISKKTFRSIKLVVPSKPAIDAYTAIARTNYDKITENIKQTNSLTETRDYLLPKLISGEITMENLSHE
ncbi:restriction endonuclease subunit S [Pseudoalteromonas sp. S3785]|uniref:restriction endonuclease subunit S n=1 Tax=Pseudoalteromonas sp. S3785 TaxID=579545 RepID=UPI00110B0308|nr:restriction endonuclease subunit S [Pseudoalteromonas sp. S3785]TMO77334.1 restriction endonuclease subunit S [Pseudoalteromonas sp. S3785]